MKKILLTSFILVFFDQLLKFWIKTHMYLGQSFEILDWFIIHFTENKGMAFGMEFGGEIGKLILTLLRIVVITVGIFYINNFIKKPLPFGVFICLGLIVGGAIGNVIDSVFYGVIFSDSYAQIAQFLPENGGYSPLLYGKVVDMFYLPLINSHFPNWLPFIGGDHFIFFRPVFNLADAGISIGVIVLILFYKNYLN